MASVVHASADATRKYLASRLGAIEALAAFIVLGLPLVTLFWLITGLQGVPRAGFWYYLALSVVPNLIANALFFEAVRLSPLSLTLPFLAFTPAFLIGTSYVINDELPNSLGALGIVLVLVGTFLLHVSELRHGITAPIRAILRERGSMLMIVVALLWSVTAAADKAAVLRSGPVAYFTIWHAGMSVPLLVYVVLRRGFRRVARHGLSGMGAAALHVTGGILQMAALPLLQASYVIAIKRAGMVVGILYGRLFFKEHHLRQRLLGAAVIVAGVVCISLR
jgi:drug/metabolite transporter (DMT)-like permease